MKEKKPRLLLILTILYLLVIAGVLTTSFLKKRPSLFKKQELNPQILGEATEVQTSPTSSSPFNVNQAVKDQFENTKEKVVEVVTEKVVEVEKTILNKINKEVQTLSQSQVEALKMQICRDLGVITGEPTPRP